MHILFVAENFFLNAILLIYSAIICTHSAEWYKFSFCLSRRNNDGKKPLTKNIVDYVGKHDVNWKVPRKKEKKKRREKNTEKRYGFSFAGNTRENRRLQIWRVVFAKSAGRRSYCGALLFPSLCVQSFSLHLEYNIPYNWRVFRIFR